MPPRPRKKLEASINAFLERLQFVGSILKDQGAIYETHLKLQNKTATAFNGIIAAGSLIEEDLLALPNYSLLVQALSKCGNDFSITQLDNNRLSIKADKFKAIVPCIEETLLQSPIPDTNIAPLNDKFKLALDAVGALATEGAQSVVAASILMNGRSVIATNRHVIFEYWHGIDLPSGLSLPKAIVQPLMKQQKPLTGFGFSKSSTTFWYENDSWMRTQFFAEQWPDVSRILDGETNASPLPNDFWIALDAIAPFSDSGLVYFENNKLQTHKEEGAGAAYDISGLPKGPIMNIKQLLLIKPHVKTIDFFAGDLTKFFGDNIRGAIAGRVQ